MAGDSFTARLDAMNERIEALAERNRALEAQIHVLRARSSAPEHAGADDTSEDGVSDDAFEAPRSRRSFFARAAVVAAGAAVGSAALERAAAAGVVGPVPVLLDSANSATASTTITGNVVDANQSVLFGATNIGGTGLAGYGAQIGVKGDSTTGTGVLGRVSGGTAEPDAFATAVEGRVQGTTGLFARGVIGIAHGATHVAVGGTSDGGIGVQGISQNNTAGEFTSQLGTAGAFSGGLTDLALGGLRTTRPPVDISAHNWGDLAMQSDGTLWLCVASGTPGRWRRVQANNTAGALTLFPAPVRVYDSRVGKPPAVGAKTPLVAGTERVIDCRQGGAATSPNNLPTDATALVVTITAQNQTAAGSLVVRSGTASTLSGPPGLAWPSASHITMLQVVTPCSAGAYIKLRLVGATGSKAHVAVDVAGFYR